MIDFTSPHVHASFITVVLSFELVLCHDFNADDKFSEKKKCSALRFLYHVQIEEGEPMTMKFTFSLLTPSAFFLLFCTRASVKEDRQIFALDC